MWERYNVAGQQAMSSGRPGEAESSFKMALQEAENQFGPHDNRVALCAINLANCLRQQGKYLDAEPLYKQAILVKERAFHPFHHELINVLENYGKMLRAAGREREAEKIEHKAKVIFAKQ
ncbi:MAG TPA: tetratricopeptide repeat protein [Drouetiella sp.]